MLSKNLTLQYKGVIYQFYPDGRSNNLRGAKIVVIESLGGEISFERDKKTLKAVRYGDVEVIPEEVSAKELADVLEALKDKRRYTPSRTHPWKRGYYRKHFKR